MHSRNCYAILRVGRNADIPAIHSAFRTLARRYHPDAGEGSSAQKFHELVEAYQAPSDPQLRRRHDVELARATGPSHIRAEGAMQSSPGSSCALWSGALFGSHALGRGLGSWLVLHRTVLSGKSDRFLAIGIVSHRAPNR